MSLEQEMAELKAAINRNTEVLLKCLEVRVNGPTLNGNYTEKVDQQEVNPPPKRARTGKGSTAAVVETPVTEEPAASEPTTEEAASSYKSAHNLTPSTPGEERVPDPAVDVAGSEDKLILEITNTVRAAITRDKDKAGEVKAAWTATLKTLGVDKVADLKGKGRTKDLGVALSRARDL